MLIRAETTSLLFFCANFSKKLYTSGYFLHFLIHMLTKNNKNLKHYDRSWNYFNDCWRRNLRRR